QLRVVAVLWHPNSDASRLSGDHGTSEKIGTVFGKHGVTHSGLILCGETHEPQNTVVGQFVQDGEFAEVLVECNQDSLFGMCIPEDLFIAGVLGPVTSPGDVMSQRHEFL